MILIYKTSRYFCCMDINEIFQIREISPKSKDGIPTKLLISPPLISLEG